jgi:hypothetical protein
MMQNGFRRIALAQGLLPERPPVRAIPMRAEVSDARRQNEMDAAGTRSDASDPGIELQVGSSA